MPPGTREAKSQMTPPSKFRIKSGERPLTPADFKECPAWSEHYDYDELDVIASWGVDREWAAKEFRRMDTGGSHPNYTILDLENLPHSNMRIFLKATFRHPKVSLIDGYVMNADAFCIGLFIGGHEFVFSRHPEMGALNAPLKHRAEKLLGIGNLFPLRYETEFSDAAGNAINSEFGS